MQKLYSKILGRMEYQEAWDYQEELLQEECPVRIKAAAADDGGWKRGAAGGGR
jgi:hypothetical protein